LGIYKDQSGGALTRHRLPPGAKIVETSYSGDKDAAEKLSSTLGSTRQQQAFRFADNEHDFSLEFPGYIKHNWHVYLRFEAHALKVIAKKFKHYSAVTIVAVMRFHSDTQEVEGQPERPGVFKMNNNNVADLARLFNLMNPQYPDFFEFRKRLKPTT